MQLLFILVTLLLLAVAVFALQNHEPVTLKFLGWQLQSSVAVVTLGATTAGALIAGLLGLAGRLRRWQRARATAGAREPTVPAGARPPAPPAGPPVA
ncbi:MAG TPA: LapA family protein [Methylomirabilota bacterium]|jgi:uncharacterized integral membrane protein|nr:LapA family protein [Methylomirabilota bacterium]